MLPRRPRNTTFTSTRRIIPGAGQNVMRNAHKQNTAKKRPRISAPKGRRVRHATTEKRSNNAKCTIIQAKKTYAVQWQKLPLLAPVIFLPQTTNGNGTSLASVQTAVAAISATDRLTSRRMRKNAKRSQVAQFRFQPFKMCFYVKCSTVLVPGDFKPCSPRRMFCSQECFETHWREKLYAHGPATEGKVASRRIPGIVDQKPNRKSKKPGRPRVPRTTSIIQFPMCHKP